ncbi:hypothetical protein ACHAWF_014733 [Thalassiosira exigua]
MTSCTVSPTSHSLTSIPAALIPAYVASFTASSSGSYFGLNATVHAQSMILPSICVPKSTFMTSSYARTVSSPQLGV